MGIEPNEHGLWFWRVSCGGGEEVAEVGEGISRAGEGFAEGGEGVAMLGNGLAG